MSSVLILFAHPAYEKSRAGRALREAAEGLPGVTLHDLYREYPDFQVEIPAEQERLLAHDRIVFQHPFYWYSAPALLKEWMDLVLEHGWAYGGQGRALEGKWLMNAVTTGGPLEAYGPQGGNRFRMREYLRPFDQTAKLCRMEYLAPFTFHRAMTPKAGADGEHHGRLYRQMLTALVEDRLDLPKAREAERLNDLLEAAHA